MRRTMLIFAVGGLAVALLVVSLGAFLFERPTILNVAVSTHDPEDYALVTAASVLLKRERKSVRLRLVPAEGAAAAAEAVEQGRADLAVARTDLAIPDNAQTMVILHRDAAILVAPASGDVREVKDLPGRKVGIVRAGPANTRLLETVLSQYEVNPDTVTTVPLAADEVAEAVRGRRVDAVMAVDVTSSALLRDVVRAVMVAGEGPPVFIKVAEADAIAQRSPLYDRAEIVRGAFGGSPPRPAEEFDTLSVTHRLVANENLSQDAVAELTRFFLQERGSIAAVAPLARSIEAPPTAKGSALPVHPGAAAYIDDDEQTFFDKYSDLIYMSAMLLGVLASGATAVLGRISARRTATLDASMARLMEMLAQVRGAGSLSVLDEIQAEADTIVVTALGGAAGDDSGRLQAFGLVLDQVRTAIRDRREFLLAAGTRSVFLPPSAAAAE